MMVYGYSLKNQKKLLEMKEVTFQVSQKEAQQLADFFSMGIYLILLYLGVM